ncbi:DNA topoisomerase III [Campylobacter sp. FMV-PI01]|uniref:DNA topoisomerase n=1 Tax=Campylobacter portucalensis TaxID=2608384 RepID=A0A6L5WI73_9BACT|nr:DNA topoisomerase III [Campylobacter portucalensis]MSN96910.1 DNA topoisomerase III [Campylobacter portucalensis]
MGRLFIAEKPELARAIAKGLNGNETKSNGFIKKGDDTITWAFGHILELYKPDDYAEKYKKWDLADLPFKIEKFKYKPIEKSKEQLNIILNLLKNKGINEVVHCGDADDEGQILVDEILQYANNKLPVKRLLINDLSEAGIKKELNNIRSNDDFYGLSQRGFARSLADWIVGLNLTRAYTVTARKKGYQDGVLNLGRVQTPILSLVVNRDQENENFKSLEYFAISGEFKSFDGIEFRANLKVDDKITDREIAQNIAKECEDKTARITTKKTENKKELPPLPYNLLKLQAECAKELGLKPDKVLSITQNLREKFHLITYNRSDCEYLPETMYDEAPSIMQSLKELFNNTKDLELNGILQNADLGIKSTAFNSANISAHHGIVPTGAKANLDELSKDELNIFTMIAKRFALQFFKAREYEATSIVVEICEYKFTASQNITTDLGFAFYLKPQKDEKNDKNDEVENTSRLADLLEGSTADCIKIKLDAKKTKPKPFYTMATLLTDLTGVAKYAKNPNIKKLLLEKDQGKKGENGGIGTPATRSNHIKSLIDNDFISVSDDKKQVIHATQKGKDLIAVAPEILTSVDMTALWFEKQKMIESRDLSLDDFLAEINKQIKDEIEKVKDSDMGNFGARPQDAITCPMCNKGYLIRRESQNKKGVFWWGCSEWRNDCKAFFYDNNGKPQLEAKPKQEIPNDAQICPKCKSGKLLPKTSQKGFNYFACNGKLKNGNWCNAKFKTNDSGELEEMIFDKK